LVIAIAVFNSLFVEISQFFAGEWDLTMGRGIRAETTGEDQAKNRIGVRLHSYPSKRFSFRPGAGGLSGSVSLRVPHFLTAPPLRRKMPCTR
jgi:hypothetical protein